MHRRARNQLDLGQVEPLVGKGLELLVYKYAVSFTLCLALKGKCDEVSKASIGDSDLSGEHSIKGLERDCFIKRRGFGYEVTSKLSGSLCVDWLEEEKPDVCAAAGP